MFVCPMEGSRILNQVVEGLTVHMEVFDKSTLEPKASKDFHAISFTFG